METSECLVIGQSNVGKTAFVLNFAEYLGVQRVEITFRHFDGFATKQMFSLDLARQELVSTTLHTTRCLQSLQLEIPAAKAKKRITLADSSGFVPGIPTEEAIRRALAQTLLELKQATLLLHMLDASGHEPVGEVDLQIARYAETRGGYLILANKLDLPTATSGLARIRAAFPRQLIIPISATKHLGFKEVRAVVARSL